MNNTPFRAVAYAAVIAVSLFSLNSVQARADQPAASGEPASPRQSSTLASPNTPVPAAPDRHATRGDVLARTALSFRGLPYRFGGKSPRSGFDCSGLVQTVCAKWGIYLPRAANAQFSSGKSIPRAQLQPGDLVFFKNTYKRGLSHVGIYIGDHLFLHAASRHLGVMVSSLLEPYHMNHWAGARRLNLSKLPPVPGEDQQPQRVILDNGVVNVTSVPADPSSAR